MNDHEAQEVFRGHFDECFKHFSLCFSAQVPKGTSEATAARKPIADFCGAIPETVADWLRGTYNPVGEKFIKLMCFLTLVGYKVIELERMKGGRRGVFELIGFGILTGEQATQLIGYAYPQKFYRILRGEQEASADKEQKMWDVWKERREELEQKKQQAKEQYQLSFTLEVRSKSVIGAEELKEIAVSTRMLTVQKTAIARIMEALLCLLEGIPEEELARLPQSNLILRLSARLSAVSARLINADQRRETQ